MVVPFILIGVLLLLITGYSIFFTTKYRDDTTEKISFFVGVAIFGYFTYSPVRKLLKNQPIIILESDSVILNTRKAVMIPKNEIEHIEVSYVDETGYFLNIKTKDVTHETNISWLEKTPDEIKELIKRYRK